MLTAIRFTDEADALTIANDTRYGLAGYIWSGDVTRALRVADQLEAGMIWINSENVRHLPTPFGGVKASGIGRNGGDWSFEFYMEQNTSASPPGRMPSHGSASPIHKGEPPWDNSAWLPKSPMCPPC